MHAHTKRILAKSDRTISDEDNFKLWQLTKDDRYLTIIINNWMPHLVKMARKLAPEHMDPNDLVQEGVIGFMRGLRKFDISKGYKIPTYCTPWILKYMRAFRDDTVSLIKNPNRYKKQKEVSDDEMHVLVEESILAHKDIATDFDGEFFDTKEETYDENVSIREDIAPLLVQLMPVEYSIALENYIKFKSTKSRKINPLKLKCFIREKIWRVNGLTKSFMTMLVERTYVTFSKEEYEFWTTGKRTKYKPSRIAPIAYNIQKALLKFQERKEPNGAVTIYLN